MSKNYSRRCAACKYLRRRCPEDCIFGPYFPSSNLDRFSCVHKIFGASNVAKMLKELPEEKRKEAVESLVIEATSRVRDPVYGSVGTIAQLKQQIMEAEYELAKTQGLIALCHAQYMHENQIKLEPQNSFIQDYDSLNFDYHPLHFDPQQKQQSTLFGDLADDESYFTSLIS